MSVSSAPSFDYTKVIREFPLMADSIDREGRIVEVSDVWLREMGYTREEVVGRHIFDFLTDEGRRFAEEVGIPAYQREGKLERLTQQYVSKSGSILDVLVSSVGIRDESGELVRSVTITENITGLVGAHRRQRLQAGALAGTLDGVSIYSLDGRLIYANEAMVKMFGFAKPEDMSGLHWTALYYDDEARRLRSEAIHLFRKAGRWRGEAVGRRLDGSTFAQEISLSAMPEHAVVCVVRDISDRKRRVEALREAEENYRSIFENANEGIFQYSLEGRYLSANAALARLLGYNSPEQLMAEITDCFAQVYANTRRRTELAEELEHRGEVQQFEIEVVRRDGARRWVELNARAVRDPDGVVIYYEGTTTDITQRRRAEAALHESIQFSQQVIANAGDGIMVYDRDRRIVIWNPMMEQLTGLDADRVLGRDTVSVLKLFRRDGVTELWERALAGEMVRSPDTPFSIPETGRAGWVNSTFCPNTNARGEVIGVIEVVHDVTQRRADQDALRYRIELEQLIYRISSKFVNLSNADLDRGIDEALGEIGRFCKVDRAYLFLIDDDGRFLTNTHEWVAPDIPSEKHTMQRRPVAEFPYAVRMTMENRPMVIPSIADVPEEGQAEREEWERQGILSLVTVPVAQSSGQHGFVGLDSCRAHRKWNDDIVTLLRLVGEIFLNALSRRRGYEELRESEQRLLHAHKMEAVGRLAGGVAHDFNNLLTAINGYSELLTSALGENSVEYTQAMQIRLAAQRASELTQQLLSFSRRKLVGSKVVSLRHIVREMRGILSRLIGEHIELKYDLATEPCWVKSDPARLEQVLLNLVVNARDAMPRGGLINVQLRRCELGEAEAGRARLKQPGTYLQWVITDTGEGMEPETLNHLFEPFFTTKEQGKGTGLGLATVYGIIDQSGGSIRVTSELGQGSVFEIYLPEAEAPKSVPPKTGKMPRLPSGNGTVLLVEDEQPVRELIKVVLRQYGYGILEATNGAEAFEIIQEGKEKIDLVLTDMVMPRMGGGELAENIERFDPSIRLMFMSGYTADTLPVLAQMGPDIPFLQKPFTPDALVRKVQVAMNRGRRPAK